MRPRDAAPLEHPLPNPSVKTWRVHSPNIHELRSPKAPAQLRITARDEDEARRIACQVLALEEHQVVVQEA